MLAPCNWDGETYCTEDGCMNPAVHYKLFEDQEPGVYPVSYALCCEHSLQEMEPRVAPTAAPAAP